jgi:hypothetical protein
MDDPPDNDGVPDQPGVRREQIGRFVPLPETDLSIAARGTTDAGGTETAPFVAEQMLHDEERQEVNNYWASAGPNGTLYDMVITSGPFKGRQRTVIASEQAGRNLYSYFPWGAAAPPARSNYELRRGNYRWTTKLFDYLTVHSPHEDALPNVETGIALNYVSNNGGTAGTNAPPVDTNAEKMAPLEGLININTAPWQVLATLPWPSVAGGPGDAFIYDENTDTMTAGANGVPDSIDCARAVVAFRDREIAAGADPQQVFESIFDLHRVPALEWLSDALYGGNTPATGGPADIDDVSGDMSPYNVDPTTPVFDGVRNDFEEQYLMLNRLSNLITTHSDSFTNYVIVQGWRGVGTATPELVVQRRRAFTSDRSGANAASRDVPIQYFFND